MSNVFLAETTHKYFEEETGRELVSVTSAFEKIGITDFSKVPFDIIEPARIRGDIVHDIAQYYGLGVLDESTVDSEFGGYLEGIKKFFRDEVVEVIGIEQIVYSMTHGYAGKLDIVYRGKRGILLDDYKSSLKPHVACKFQTAAYAYAFEKLHKIKINGRRGVYFTAGGDYRIEEHSDPLRRDFDEFITILRAAILKLKYKIK